MGVEGGRGKGVAAGREEVSGLVKGGRGNGGEREGGRTDGVAEGVGLDVVLVLLHCAVCAADVEAEIAAIACGRGGDGRAVLDGDAVLGVLLGLGELALLEALGDSERVGANPLSPPPALDSTMRRVSTLEADHQKPSLGPPVVSRLRPVATIILGPRCVCLRCPYYTLRRMIPGD